MKSVHFEKIKKHMPKILVLLLIVCAVQGWVIYKRVIRPASGLQLADNSDTAPSFMGKQFKKQQNESRKFFGNFFGNDFFSNNADPFKQMQRIQKHFEAMMNNPGGNMFGNSWGGWFSGGNSLGTGGIRIHTREKRNAYVITAEIPHLKDNKLNVSIDKNGVSIQGEFTQSVEKKDAQGNVIEKSERHQSISRKIAIASDADYDHARIVHKGDKIIITIPKRRV